MVWLIHASLALTEGRFTYALDDAYIHMAVAKHLAQAGVWGVTPYAFSSSSSSPLWTLILAGLFRLLGVHELIPLVLNLIFATLTLTWIHAHVKNRVSPGAAFIVLATAILFPPLPIIVMGGMEHTLQMLLVLMFVTEAARRLTRPPRPGGPSLPVMALAALLPIVRYEDLFVVAVVCGVLLARRRTRDAVAIGIAAFVPIAVFGAYSMAHGAPPIPNTVLLKGVSNGVQDVVLAVPRNLWRSKPLAELLALALALLAVDHMRPGFLHPRRRMMILIFACTALLHLQLAKVGWLYRYEAYLVVLAIAAVGPALVGPPGDPAGPRTLSSWPSQTAAAAFAVAVALARIPVLASGPLASQNIYQQQVQTGRFLAAAYSGQVVAVSDIGAVNFLADLRCIDLMGLGDLEVAKIRLAHGGLTAAQADDVVRRRHARIVISYERWFHDMRDGVTGDGIPPRWDQPVGRWAIDDCVVCGADTLAFFGMDPAERDTLAARLRAFEPRLPAGVDQSGPYVALGGARR